MARKRRKKTAPIVFSFGANEPETIEFDPTEKQAFMFASGHDHMLVVAWDIDEAGHGAYRVKVVGAENDELVLKELEPGSHTAAFFGEVAVVGAAQTDLYTSFGYQDDDIKDTDGYVVNKVKEIVIKPKQD